ncbi:MAG: GNAT family N-acetyltransferase [Bacteroidetes bacterium]|nr:GNAT family N-acetyltransferase [Bacteroidota bacterium]
MEDRIVTPRLFLKPISVDDADFILEIVNMPEWIRFIGDRNVKNKNDAIAFIQRITANQNINYWVVSTIDGNIAIGIVSLVKRDYLDFFDVGFAFLQRYSRQGFAYEATRAFLHHLAHQKFSTKILASTLKENDRSIALLHKLKFQFERQVENNNEEFLIYSAPLTIFCTPQH